MCGFFCYKENCVEQTTAKSQARGETRRRPSGLGVSVIHVCCCKGLISFFPSPKPQKRGTAGATEGRDPEKRTTTPSVRVTGAVTLDREMYRGRLLKHLPNSDAIPTRRLPDQGGKVLNSYIPQHVGTKYAPLVQPMFLIAFCLRTPKPACAGAKLANQQLSTSVTVPTPKL